MIVPCRNHHHSGVVVARCVPGKKAGVPGAVLKAVPQRGGRGERQRDPPAGHGYPGRPQDWALARLKRAGIQGECGPKLNEPEDPAAWLARPDAPKPKLVDEKPPGETVPYEELVRVWGEPGGSP